MSSAVSNGEASGLGCETSDNVYQGVGSGFSSAFGLEDGEGLLGQCYAGQGLVDLLREGPGWRPNK